MRIALLGFGTVGSSVAKALALLTLPGVEVSHVYNRDVARKRDSAAAAHVGSAAVWTERIDEVLDSDADVLVELVGGLEPANEWIERALRAGKSVVTANKQLICYRGPALVTLAREHGAQLRYGAAVAGGVPVLPGIAQGLSGDRITRISGILNGTCNYILSRMETGDRYADVLRDAQELGYAEADPVADVGGSDARAKLCILARMAMQAELDPESVATQSIESVDAVDFAYAKELGCTIRQVSRVQVEGAGVYARVAPVVVPLHSPLAWSHGTQNMVVTTGVLGGDVVFSGHGAGGDATAVAVVSDLVAIAQGSRAVAFPAKATEVTGDATAPHYLRFVVDDRPGIVAAIAGALSKERVNIDSLLQRRGYPKDRLPFVVTTEPCPRSVVTRAVKAMEAMECLVEAPLALEMLVVDDKDEATA